MTVLSSFEIFANWMLAVLLIAVILFDLRRMILPNWLALSFVLLFAVGVAWTLPFSDLVWRVGIAVTFSLSYGA